MSSVAQQNDCPRCRELEQVVVRLEARIVQLEKQNKKLLELLEKSQRAGKRQAAPFRKEKKKAEPKRPGSQKGRRLRQTGIPDCSAARKDQRSLRSPPAQVLSGLPIASLERNARFPAIRSRDSGRTDLPAI